MKTAVIVVGPEKSGTKMLTECFVRSGWFGDYTHAQRLDNLDFRKTPERIVLRRSVPHGSHWLNYEEICQRLQYSNYRIKPVVILRDQVMEANSQVRVGYATSIDHAHERISRAWMHIWKQIPEAEVVLYEALVGSEDYRQRFFARWNLNPDMEFYDANSKYTGGGCE